MVAGSWGYWGAALGWGVCGTRVAEPTIAVCASDTVGSTVEAGLASSAISGWSTGMAVQFEVLVLESGYGVAAVLVWVGC